MGEKETVTRLVLDTNVLVSALLFRSQAAFMFKAWRGGRFLLAASEPILAEYAQALRFPELGLSEQEPDAIMEQFVLPYCERFEAVVGPRYCSDPDGDKFINCALVARAEALVSEDKALLSLASRVARVPIIPAADACARYCR